MNAINPAYDKLGDFELVDELSKIGNVKVPKQLKKSETQKSVIITYAM